MCHYIGSCLTRIQTPCVSIVGQIFKFVVILSNSCTQNLLPVGNLALIIYSFIAKFVKRCPIDGDTCKIVVARWCFFFKLFISYFENHFTPFDLELNFIKVHVIIKTEITSIY